MKKAVSRRGRKTDDRTLPQLVRAFLLDEEPLNDNLASLQYRVVVYRYDNNVAHKIVGRIYDNLLTLEDDLAREWGSGRYRLYITVRDDNDRQLAFFRIEDFFLRSALGEIQKPDMPARAHRDAELAHDPSRVMQAMMQEFAKSTNSLIERVLDIVAERKQPTLTGNQLLETFRAGLRASGKSVPEDEYAADPDPEIAPEKDTLEKLMEIVLKVLPLFTSAQGAGGPAPETSSLLNDPAIKTLIAQYKADPSSINDLIAGVGTDK